MTTKINDNSKVGKLACCCLKIACLCTKFKAMKALLKTKDEPLKMKGEKRDYFFGLKYLSLSQQRI